MPIVEINGALCINCGKCVEICPQDVLYEGNSTPVIQFREDCQSCFLCRLYCPTQAIQVTAERARPTALPW